MPILLSAETDIVHHRLTESDRGINVV